MTHHHSLSESGHFSRWVWHQIVHICGEIWHIIVKMGSDKRNLYSPSGADSETAEIC